MLPALRQLLTWGPALVPATAPRPMLSPGVFSFSQAKKEGRGEGLTPSSPVFYSLGAVSMHMHTHGHTHMNVESHRDTRRRNTCT